MSEVKQKEPRFTSQVEELKQMLDRAASKSPDLWLTIEKSVAMAEIASNSLHAQNAQVFTFLSETNSANLDREGV